jgi:hypothetical protein
MEEAPKKCECPECQKRQELEQEHEKMGLAMLVALIPMLVITLFGQIGLF